MPTVDPHRFTIQQSIGKGSFGEAYVAMDKSTDRLVVIKRQEAGGSRSYAEMEHSLLETLRHRHIVRYLGGWCAGNQLFIVMEFCNGGNLRQLIRRHRDARHPIDEMEIRRFVCQLCAALRYCHLQHILHRDLKAENVLLHDRQVKLADFGLARSISSTTSFASTRVGTPGSISPEVSEGHLYNNRADMWAVGVMLYELMTLSRPFTGETVGEVFLQVQRESPDAREKSGNRYSSSLYDLCDQLLSKDPTRRPSAWDVLSLPWLADDASSDDTERRKQREAEAWSKITVDALYPESVVRELVSTTVVVNIRSKPSRKGDVVRTISFGDTVEELSQVQPAGTSEVWLELPNGFCIRDHPHGPHKHLFKTVPKWRVRRQGAPGLPFTPPSVCATVDESGERKSTALLLKGFADPTDRVAALLDFLDEAGIPEELVGKLAAAHDTLATAEDDAEWTSFCITALRPLKCAHCIRVLRLALQLMDATAPTETLPAE